MSEFLVGAKAIAKKLEEMGVLPQDDPCNEDRVYYLARSQKVAFGKFGKSLITTPTKLQQAISKSVS
jgi:hypothetical protein